MAERVWRLNTVNFKIRPQAKSPDRRVFCLCSLKSANRLFVGFVHLSSWVHTVLRRRIKLFEYNCAVLMKTVMSRIKMTAMKNLHVYG